MKTLVNYADTSFSEQQSRSTESALKYGGFDTVSSFSPQDLDGHFKEQNKAILQYKKGAGYWLWKPYIVLRVLENVNYGDYVMYCDSGVVFRKSVDFLIDAMIAADEDIMVFELPLLEKQWSKRDAFVLMECDGSKFSDTNQRLASFFLLKKTHRGMNFVKQFLHFSQNQSILTDRPNICGLENYPSFIEHRHDQSVFSLLTKKFEVDAFRDPSQFGKWPRLYASGYHRLPSKPAYRPSNYGQILFHCRKAECTRMTARQWIIALAPIRVTRFVLSVKRRFASLNL